MSSRSSKNFSQTVFLLGLSFICYPAAFAQDARLIARNIFPSVVMLEMRDGQNRPIALGSGFFVRPDEVVTNYHVIENASSGSAKIVGKFGVYDIEGVVAVDKAKDLALLKLTGVRGKPVVLADISKIEVGQEVFALGNPKGLEGTISAGIISGSSLREVENENLIQITAPISPGSSGGPVVNRQGEVIGVAVASLKGGQNLNFAIPSSYLALLLANSKSAISLSDVPKGPPSSTSRSTSSGPTAAETTAWLTDTLTAKGGRQTGETIVQRNERIVFDNCRTFGLVLATRDSAGSAQGKAGRQPRDCAIRRHRSLSCQV
jgi:S1-C subfamily serine protease